MGVENLTRISEWAPQDFRRSSRPRSRCSPVLGFALARPMATPPVPRRAPRRSPRHGAAATRATPSFWGWSHRCCWRGRSRARSAPRGRGRGGRASRASRLPRVSAAALAIPRRCGSPRRSPRVDGPSAPISALAAVPPDLRARPVLNRYGFGGYLIWSGVRPFIDGRADMYGGTQRPAATAGSRPACPSLRYETLRRYRVDWTIFAPDERDYAAALDRTPGWRRLHTDATRGRARARRRPALGAWFIRRSAG